MRKTDTLARPGSRAARVISRRRVSEAIHLGRHLVDLDSAPPLVEPSRTAGL